MLATTWRGMVAGVGGVGHRPAVARVSVVTPAGHRPQLAFISISFILKLPSSHQPGCTNQGSRGVITGVGVG